MASVRRFGDRRSAVASVEWPTVAVAAAIYAGFGLLTWHWHALPWWAILPVGGYLVAWHGSLQHEVVHGHPTPWSWLNEALIFASLWLWLPFRLYRDSHLIHHDDQYLTDPLRDPESYYVTPDTWRRSSAAGRVLLQLHNTLAGRLLLGPTVAVAHVAADALARLARGDFSHAGAWLLHLAGCALVLVWVMGVCGIGCGEYLLLAVYPGISLTLLRSFAEHQARTPLAERTAILTAGAPMGLLYLHNNLHAVHHARPDVPWYRLPQLHREWIADGRAAAWPYRLPGYLYLFGRYLLRPKESPVRAPA